MNGLTQFNRTRILLFLIAMAFVCLAISPSAQAACQEGCLANGNTVLGDDALLNSTTHFDNTAVGFNALLSNTTGSYNTANGTDALHNNTTGDQNTAIGDGALAENFTGNYNTAAGEGALFANNADNNTATGYRALARNTSGTQNTASGVGALFSNTTGNYNTATGLSALRNNMTADNNTANGINALLFNTTGYQNTACGGNAMLSNGIGINNTANGFDALYGNSSGNLNTANGVSALQSNSSGSNNTADGVNALLNNRTGNSNVALGFQAGLNLTNGNNNIDIGAGVLGTAGEANTIRIGKSGTQKKTFIAGIRGVTVASGVGVIVGTTGQLGTVISSARFKEAIKPMDKASEAILALKPVTFRYKHELDPDGVTEFGLIAEQVEKIDPDLVVYDEDGKVTTVRYEAVNAMLLNEFLKEHRKVEEQDATIGQMKKEIESLTAIVQKVSNRLESKSACGKAGDSH